MLLEAQLDVRAVLAQQQIIVQTLQEAAVKAVVGELILKLPPHPLHHQRAEPVPRQPLHHQIAALVMDVSLLRKHPPQLLDQMEVDELTVFLLAILLRVIQLRFAITGLVVQTFVVAILSQVEIQLVAVRKSSQL